VTAPDPPRWSALRVGPGGIPPEHVHPVPAAAGMPEWSATPAPGARSAGAPGQTRAGDPFRVPTASPKDVAAPPLWPAVPSQQPAAVLGSFDDDADAPRPSRRAVWGWVALAVVAIILVATALWSSATPQAAQRVVPATGECLSAADGSVVAVDCASDAADLRVVARYDGAGDRGSCDTVRPDVVMVAGDRSVLCLDYVARAGECLFAGGRAGTGADSVGKRPCADAYRGTQDLYRVLAVLPGETDDASCPVGTLRALVHRSPTEVVCLGFP
jgi:hypothetical protein